MGIKFHNKQKGFTLIEVLWVIVILGLLSAIATAQFSGFRIRAFDAAAQQTLRQAYMAAIAYFVDTPDGRVTLSNLKGHGYIQTENVSLKIEGDTLPDLLMFSFYNNPSSQIYMVDSRGSIRGTDLSVAQIMDPGGFGPSNRPDEDPKRGRPDPPGIIETQNSIVKETLNQVYRAAIAFFNENPGGEITLPLLSAYGFTPNETVNLAIADGTLSGFLIMGSSSLPGTDTYTLNLTGIVPP